MSCVAVPEVAEGHHARVCHRRSSWSDSLVEVAASAWTGSASPVPPEAPTRRGRRGQPLSFRPGTGRPSSPYHRPPCSARPPRRRLRYPRGGGAGPLGRAPDLRTLRGSARGRPSLGLLRGTAHGKRPARPPPRVGPCVQGPLLPLPHHGRGVRSPDRAGWDTHGLPVEVEVEKSLGITGKRRSRRRWASPSSPGSAVSPSTPTWTNCPSHHPHRLLGRHGRAYWTLEPRLHRVGVVAPPAAFRPGPPLRGPQGRAVLPALWHRAVESRARPARRLPRRGGRVGLRAAAPGRRRTRRTWARPSGWPCGRPRRGP